MTETGTAEAALSEVRRLGDRAAELALSAAPVLLAAAEALHAGYRAALASPVSFARGRSLTTAESRDLVDRSARAEFAVALQISERAVTREIEYAALLVDELPRTRAAPAAALMRWEAGQVICAVAASLPAQSRAALDERAVELAVAMTPTQLRRALARLRDELHERPLAERHERAREGRAVWLRADADGMATLCAHLPAPTAVGALARLDRIARALRDASTSDGGGDGRTLAQLRADALGDLLCLGDVPGTATDADGRGPTAFVPGIRAEVTLLMAETTASGADDGPVDLDGYGLVPVQAADGLVGAETTFTPVRSDATTGAILSVGRTHRVPPPRMRLLVQLRDRTCRFPGCTRPASTSEADHTVEWRNGGETSPGNLASLCVAHHHVRHGDRWTYVLHPDGAADWTTPTGRRVTTRPPARFGGRPGPRPPSVDVPAPL
ncbi:HNH endonuclease [Rathayibacter sp. ZW T2_19]|uniref:HNH endonuclease n=1 Tax=Rathayibacter rubneri TaxID=2950106 RepID=A0A9X2ITE8_9MICO|nr:HNH endonuclease signature motif containing protein [Rathayibacter rubneri]MCM6761579.1 HNH endonuclease [Rathayibacter rubneri]